jgi:hypothetical protein
MFTTNTDNSNSCASRAVSPRATTIATIAISSGMSPATTAPKTRSRMISAAGSPNLSSPFSRSSCERVLKSSSSVFSPVTDTANAPPSSASTLSTSASAASSSSSRATGTIVACRSSETSPAAEPPRYVRAAASAEMRSSATKSRTKLWNWVESTVYFAERMTTMSVTDVAGSDGNAASRASSARSDSGSLVGEPSVVRLPPRSVAIATTARTMRTIQAPIVRHAWRALQAAKDPVESLMRPPPSPSPVRT